MRTRRRYPREFRSGNTMVGLNFGEKKKIANIALLKEVGIWVGQILFVVVLACLIAFLWGVRVPVSGQSMSGTLENGQVVLADRFLYKLTDPKANDLIIFLPNGNEKSHYYIKRVIAVPGDTVQITDGVVYVNGEPFPEEIDDSFVEHGYLAENPIVVKEDEFFVLGDNRNNSEDSRYANIGNVKKSHIYGKAWLRVSPLKEWKRLN